MKTTSDILPMVLALLAGLTQAVGQGTAFTYQGRLNDGASPANGLFDFSFSVWSAASGPAQVGATLNSNSVAVSNGLFTVTLEFGPGVFTGEARWLEIGVRTNIGPFTLLLPRQRLTPTPYALHAAGAATAQTVADGAVTSAKLAAGAVTSSAILDGTIVNADIAAGALISDTKLAMITTPSKVANSATTATSANIANTIVARDASGNFSAGTVTAASFIGNGAGMTNIALTTLNSYGVFSWPGSFALSSSPGVGSLPASVTAADVNGDGRLDLISANSSANTLSVLTNNGSGGFALSSSPAVGSWSLSVTAADVNGDGRVDLISANFNASTLTVLTNNGGGFALSSSPAVGSMPYSVAAADVNGDGRVDLISANGGADTLTVLTNNGSGGFALSSSPAVGSNPQSVTAVDVNGDGRVDLISANSGANTLTVLTNNGSGGFALSSSPAVGGHPQSVTAADVNGDGRVDLISANFNANTLTVLTNNGSGGFALSSSPAVGNGPASVTAADVNGDGRTDLVSANFNANTLTVLTNNGSGGFALSSSLGVGGAPASVIAADVNGDGRTDLVSANRSSATLSVLFNEPIFTGNGSGLTALDASQLASGTVADDRLSAGIARLYAAQTFFADNRFAGQVSIGTAPLSNPLTVEAGGTSSGGVSGFAEVLARFKRPAAGHSAASIDANSGQDAILYLAENGAAWWGLRHDSDGPNKFDLRYHGGGANTPVLTATPNGFVGIGTTSPTNRLHVNGGVSATAFVTTSDRNAKENFAAIDPREVLNKVAALPISRWNFKELRDGSHIGPTAQDFHAAFGLGSSDTTIMTVDADGVALAAIQGLNEKVEEKRREQGAWSKELEARSRKLEAENAELKQELAELKRLVNSLVK